MNHLAETARLMLADHKGLLAMDESNGTCNKRFAKAGIEQTEEARRRYRELIVTTPGLGECISGVILYDETIRQARADGTPFVKIIADCGHHPRHQSRCRREGSCRPCGGKDHRGARRTAGAPSRLFPDGRAVRQVARGDWPWRRPSRPAPASTPTRTRSPATPPFVRSLASFPSLSQKF